MLMDRDAFKQNNGYFEKKVAVPVARNTDCVLQTFTDLAPLYVVLQTEVL